MTKLAERVRTLPPYLFAELDRKKEIVMKRGVDVIDLGVGDPDLPTPSFIVSAMAKEIKKAENHRYPSYTGTLAFRTAVAEWYKKRFRVSLKPQTEVIALIGSKEGIAHFPLAFIDPGDVALVPDPAYPVYEIGTKFAGGKVHRMPLLEKNGFLPDLSKIPERVRKKAKVMFLNYPNNPTSAVATKKFFRDVVDFARAYDIIVVHDAAYTEIYYEGPPPPSFLQVPGAKKVGIEFHSLSKTYNMTGWRIGFACGNADLVGGLGKIKTNVDSGAFTAIQNASIVALKKGDGSVEKLREIYRKRRDIMVKSLQEAGFSPFLPTASFYVWMPVPEGMTSSEFAGAVLEKAGVVCTPGVGFGQSGEGYVRFSLTVPEKRLREAARRMRELKV
ncbi:MAG: LL-diaminopimelate aminotransferase [Deltaproteobacteria bacterium]|nr:MAG: LL-diaminopimelate aminotransferase [Deltaproteobacteria bacterium]